MVQYEAVSKRGRKVNLQQVQCTQISSARMYSVYILRTWMIYGCHAAGLETAFWHWSILQ